MSPVLSGTIVVIENEGSSKGRLKRLSTILFAILIHGIFAVLALIGVLTINTMYVASRAGEIPPAMAVVFGLFGLLMTVIGIGFFYLGYVGGPNFFGRLEAEREKYRDRPWLINRQWRARRVIHTTKYTALFMWIWCLLWWAILGFLWSVNRELIIADLQGSWQTAIPTAIPFVAGSIGLLVAIGMSWQRYRHGGAVLSIDTLPGYLGERFRGDVRVRLVSRPSEPATVTLTCGSLTSRRVRTARGKTETEWVTERLWSTSKQVGPSQMIFGSGRITLPVDIELPLDLPESGHLLDEPQIVWKLKITPGSVLDRPLSSEFEVPIFARRDVA